MSIQFFLHSKKTTTAILGSHSGTQAICLLPKDSGFHMLFNAWWAEKTAVPAFI